MSIAGSEPLDDGGDSLKSSNLGGEACPENDWDCHKLSWTSYVTGSLLRLLTGDFTSLNADLVVCILFLGLCLLSWQCVQFMIQRLVNGKCPYKGSERFQLRSSATSYDNNGGHPLLDDNEVFEQSVDTDDRREADVRAAGDSWEQDEYDPDYDANNEIMVMLLQDQPDDSDEISTPLRSENEDEGMLHDLGLGRPDDEVQIVDVEDQLNPTAAINGPQVATPNRNSGGKNEEPSTATKHETN